MDLNEHTLKNGCKLTESKDAQTCTINYNQNAQIIEAKKLKQKVA